ncbi:hypothetical protein CLAIMM_13958 [Cladophialophora immunda]|nr:hypothetical protein CLAIMM_13958 [Cladophialophora immunda]
MDLMICTMCGGQHSTRAAKSCKVCDDPRQYLPPEGEQSWTTLRELQQSRKYRNVFRKDPCHSGVVSVWTEPQFAIGQRAILCCTPDGNILWDCITYLDDNTVSRINELGGIAAIVISHPHYYTTMLHWAEAFGCPVYLSCEDEEWLLRKGEAQRLWKGKELELLNGHFKVVKLGGHFPGSSVMLWKSERKLFVADTITVIPSGVYHVDRLPGTSSFTFMWSYPNMVSIACMCHLPLPPLPFLKRRLLSKEINLFISTQIPLPPNEVHSIWKSLAPLDFDDCHGAFWTRDTRGNSKARVLDSAKLFVKFMNHPEHAIFQETLIKSVVLTNGK